MNIPLDQLSEQSLPTINVSGSNLALDETLPKKLEPKKPGMVQEYFGISLDFKVFNFLIWL